MQLSVVTPEGSFYDGEVDSLVAPGWDGSLGVLKGHAPMVTELGSGLLVANTSGEETKIVLAGGYLQVLKDKVTVLATFAVNRSEIDAEAARKELEEAQSMKASTQDDMKSRLAAIERAKALIDHSE